MKEEDYLQKVAYYYQSSQKDYEIIWGLKKHQSLHYGFWEKGIKNHEQAVNNMTKKIYTSALWPTQSLVADLGCGIGGPAFFMHQHFQLRVDGVSITSKQIAQANCRAKELHKENELRFFNEDYCNTSLPSDTYDGVYGIESFCHALEKKNVLAEAYRILKKGGKLVVADFFWNGTEKNDKDKIYMKNWANSWAVHDFAYIENFKNTLEALGYKNIEMKMVTKNVLPSIKRLYHIFLPSYVADAFLRLIGKRKGKHENMFSALYQYQCYKRGLWEYCIFSAEK